MVRVDLMKKNQLNSTQLNSVLMQVFTQSTNTTTNEIHTYVILQCTIYGGLVIFDAERREWLEQERSHFRSKNGLSRGRFAHSHPSQKLTTETSRGRNFQ